MGPAGNMFGQLIKMFLVLLLNSRPAEKAAEGPDLTYYVDQPSMAYAEVDVAELRRSWKSVPELEKALFVGRKRAEVTAEAAAALSEIVRADQSIVASAISEVRRVGIWLLGFADNMDGIRVLVVLDRGNAKGVLAPLLARLTEGRGVGEREIGWVKTKYLGTPVYGRRVSRDFCVWLAEDGGRIVASTDLMAAQGFLLRSKAREGARFSPSKRARPFVARAEVNTQAVLAGFLGLMDGSDWEEVAMMSSLFDFPAWKKVTVTLDKNRVEAVGEIEGASGLAKALAGPHRIPALVSAIPAGCGLALIGAPRSPAAVWEYAKAGFERIGGLEDGDPALIKQFLAEFNREIGLDLEKDVIGNAVEIGIIVPGFSEMRDLERTPVIAGRAKDAAAARKSLGSLAAKVGDEEERVPRDVKGVSVWDVDGVRFALAGDAVMIGPVERDSSGFDAVLKQKTAGGSELAKLLAERYGDAGGVGVLNPSFVARGRDMGLITAGLSFRDSALRLRVDYDVQKFASALLDISATEVCTKNLSVISAACNRYLNDYGKYPPSLEAVLKYMGNDSRRTSCPLSGKAYVYNKTLAGKQVGTVANRGQVVLARDVEGAHPAGGCLVYLSGRTVRLSTKEFEKATR